MFTVNAENNHIKLTRGNSCKIDILPLLVNESLKTQTPIILSDDDKVIFTVASPSGKIYLQKVLTADDYDEGDETLNLIIFPEDTIDMQPYDYVYDVLVVYDDGSTTTFIRDATFSILSALGTYKDLEVE